MNRQAAIEISGIDFAAAHFVSEAEQCERLHGHNYQVSVTVQGTLNAQGMLIDFRELKRRVRQLCQQWDHQILLPQHSKKIKLSKEGPQTIVRTPASEYSFPTTDVVVLDVIETTAEELASILCSMLIKDLRIDFPTITQVTVSINESSTSRAIVTLPL